MDSEVQQHVRVEDAIRHVNSLVKSARECGHNVLSLDVGEHLYPGDVYDAYEEIERKPVVDDVLDEESCGPLAAVFLARYPNESALQWQQFVTETFDHDYIYGFRSGYALMVPTTFEGDKLRFLRGVHDGVMAHAAVF